VSRLPGFFPLVPSFFLQVDPENRKKENDPPGWLLGMPFRGSTNGFTPAKKSDRIFDFTFQPFGLRQKRLGILRRGSMPRKLGEKINELNHLLLFRAASKYRHIFENSVDGIFQRAFDGRFLRANQACARILGYSYPGELIAENADPKRPFYGSRERQAEFQQLLHELGIVQGFEYEVGRPDGRKIWVSENAQAIRNAHSAVLYYEGTIRDITERKAEEEQIRFLSFHDSLTGLYNRSFFEEEMKRLDTQRQLPLSILMGDVNNLKLVNDAFGHGEGDRLLLKVATVLKDCCRKEDVIARLGGDEFAILLPQMKTGIRREIIQRIKIACQNLSRDSIPVSVALGTATKEDAGQDIQGVIKEAEDQMYREKLMESKNHKAAILFSLRHTLYKKSLETEEHVWRSKRLAIYIGRAFGLPQGILDELDLLADLHDIGKVGLSQEIIVKPGSLSSSEWEVIKKHPEIGYRIAISSPELAHIADAIWAHHEWWDGTGYPQGLQGEKIPFLARLFAIVDAYEVMTRGRPYKGPLTHQGALHELKQKAGRQFDPKLVEKFLKVAEKSESFEKWPVA
jgi:diguanylate cyclase (GGDEF)-like protein/PAS domain S-box-containing protein